MRIRKDVIIIVISFIAIIILSMFLITRNFYSSNYITDYEAIVDVDEYGNIHVEETVVMKYSEYDNYFIREIKLAKEIDEKIVLDKSSLHNVEVMCFRGDLINDADYVTNITNRVDIISTLDGNYSYLTEDGYEHLPDIDNIEYICIDAIHAGHLDKTMTYVYKYDIYNQATLYNDCSELYYKFFDGNDMQYDVKNARVSVSIPKQVNSNDFHCYSHGVNKVYEEKTSNSATFYMKNVYAGKTLAVRAILPTDVLTKTEDIYQDIDVFDKYLSVENKLNEKAINGEKFRKIALILNIVTIGLMSIALIIIYFAFDKEIVISDVGAIHNPPYDYNPALVGYLMHQEDVREDDYIATLLDLIRKGYIEYKELDGEENNYYLIKKLDSSYELANYERSVFSYFIDMIGDGEKVSISQIKEYGKSETDAKNFIKMLEDFKKDVKLEGKKLNFYYDQKMVKTKLMFVLIIPLLFLIFLIVGKFLFDVKMLASVVVTFVFIAIFVVYVLTFKKRTKEGSIHYNKWKAYKEYLSKSNVKDMKIDQMDYFDSMLVYATTLGLSKRLMNELKVEAKGSSELFNNHYYSIYPCLYYSCISCNDNYHASISSSGGSSGGGFSGGGGGGGGFSGGR